MKKTKGKVLSLILASALIVSSFSTSLVSAATTRETGSLSGVTDKIYLVSSDSGNSAKVDIEDLIGEVTVKTYDHDDADSADFVSYTHASGDRLVSISGEGELYVKKNASGKEVITVTFQGDYVRDDKDVVVRGSKDITIYADKAGKQFLGKYDAAYDAEGYTDDARPDAFESAAVNDEYLKVGVYVAEPEDSAATGDNLYQTIKAEYSRDKTFKDGVDDDKVAKLKDSKSKVFEQPVTADGVISLKTKALTTAGDDNAEAIAAVETAQTKVDEALADLAEIVAETTDAAATTAVTNAEEAATAAKTALNGTTTAADEVDTAVTKLGLAKTAVTDDTGATYAVYGDPTKTAVTDAKTALDAAKTALDTALTEEQDAATPDTTDKFATTGTETLKVTFTGDSKTTDFKVAVDKKYRVDYNAEVNKKASTTYITREGQAWDDEASSKEIKDDIAWAISNYDIALDSGTLTVTNGKIGNVTGSGTSTVVVDGGTVGDIKANDVSVDGGSVGTIKVAGTAPKIEVNDGKVKAIDADKAVVDISGGVVSGNVVGASVSIDSDDEEISTTVNGNVTAKGFDADADADDIEATINVASSSEADVVVTGTLKGEVTLNDEVAVGAIDADYQYNVNFDSFTGKITGDTGLKNTNGVTITLNGDSKVSVKGKVAADTVSIEDGSKLTVDEATFGTVEEEGTLAVPAGKLFIEDSLTDVTLQLTTGLVAGATAFEAYTDAVDPDDFVALGYSVEQKAKNDDVDKFVIKAVTFAGLSFDKTELSVAKGYEDKITLSNYPDGTALPEGAQIEWAIDGNDDYITLTVEGNVGTVKVVDFNKDYATDNQAEITATVVDADGNAYDDYVVATTKVTGTALPASTLTLDTKSASVGVGGLYQFLAKSSSGAVITAVSSDEQIATVTPYDLLDPRGAKFSVNGVKEGKATITATDANGATASFEVTVVKVEGTLKADTTSYKFAPGNIYDVKFTVTGTTAVPVVTANGKVVSVVSRGNGVYRVTALNPGTAWVQATVGTARVSVTFVVENGATAGGVRGNNVSNL